MQMSRAEYQDETIGQLLTRIAGFYEVEEMRNREAWERCRWSTAVLLNIQLAKKDRIQAHKLLPLPWDEDTQAIKKSRKLTPEEQAAIFGKVDKLMKTRKHGSIGGPISEDRNKH
jgi:hypothetical protein